jgi:hypothetical protein
MARPKLGKEPYVNLGLRLDPQMVPALDAYVADLQRELWEIRIDRGTALRRLVVSGLRTLGYVPALDAGGGHGEAPVTLGEARTADLSPVEEDQSSPQAASRQDQPRTTGRTGRKRATSAQKG